MKTVGIVPARFLYLRHLPSCTGHSYFISATRKVAWYRKYPRSTCRWHRARLETLVKYDERARQKQVVIYRPFYPSSRCFTCGWERTRKKMLTAVTYLHTRHRRNTSVSMAIVVSQEIRRTRRRPAETNFSHPDCGESRRPPAQCGCSSGNFI